MKKSEILTTVFALLAVIIISLSTADLCAAPAEKQMYYELKIYRLKDPSKNALFDKYLKEAYIPAMHKAGVKHIGVFKPVENDTAYGKIIYVLVPYSTVDQYAEVFDKLEKDKAYLEAGKEFLDAPHNDPPFTRYETVFMKAFAFMPTLRVPSFPTPPSERIYELRSYESRTEAKATKKIEMFNEGGEIAIFEKIGANAVFYGQVMIGSLKPRLIYMTTYSDMKSREDHWKAFVNHPDWKNISSKEEYANTVIKPNAYLLHPTDYSDY